MKRIYLDSNVLIAHFSVDKAEEAKKKLVPGQFYGCLAPSTR